MPAFNKLTVIQALEVLMIQGKNKEKIIQVTICSMEDINIKHFIKEFMFLHSLSFI